MVLFCFVSLCFLFFCFRVEKRKRQQNSNFLKNWYHTFSLKRAFVPCFRRPGSSSTGNDNTFSSPALPFAQSDIIGRGMKFFVPNLKCSEFITCLAEIYSIESILLLIRFSQLSLTLRLCSCHPFFLVLKINIQLLILLLGLYHRVQSLLLP